MLVEGLAYDVHCGAVAQCAARGVEEGFRVGDEGRGGAEAEDEEGAEDVGGGAAFEDGGMILGRGVGKGARTDVKWQEREFLVRM